MPYIRLFHAAFGRRRGQLALAPPGARSTSDGLFRGVGLGLVATGLLLIGSIFARDAQWLGSMTVGAANDQCDNNGNAQGCFFTPEQDTGTPLATLKGVKVPQDDQLRANGPFIAKRDDLIALGKALFWDQQVGSDGQACGSCHFSAGADPRIRNAVSPGLKATPVDTAYSFGGADTPNYEVVQGDFPSHLLANPDRRGSTVLQDSNDIVGSAGVFNRKFSAVGTTPILNNPDRVPSVPDVCRSVADPDGFHIGDINVRKVEPRNTPTMINAVFNNRNFWDGRAQDVFNGVTPFGARDTGAVLYQKIADKNLGDTLKGTSIAINFASLASQAVGPPLSNFEMSCENRTFPDVGHKMLGLRPLALQAVAPNDSVLKGLSNTRYRDMVQNAFNAQWWSSRQSVAIGDKTYSQMEANFSLFWGLSLKAYMETLISNDSPVDRFLSAPARNGAALSASARRGLNIFQSFGGVAPDPTDLSGTKTINVTLSTGKPADARCITCHGAAETSNASVTNVQNSRLERMTLRDGTCAIYDQGFLNTGLRPLHDDPGVAGTDTFPNNSFSETVLAGLGQLHKKVPTADAPFGLSIAVGGTGNCEAAVVNGAFKTPGLRNVELTGPYFHNGGQATLMQVVDFYNRGGDFDEAQTSPTRLRPIDENIRPLGLAERDKRDLVNFLIAMTDERVAFEKAPFDHPSICVANGQQGDDSRVPAGPSLPGGGRTIAADRVLCIPASGGSGIANRLPTFLHADPHEH